MAGYRYENPKTSYRRQMSYGNAALQLDVKAQMEAAPRKQLSVEARKNRERARYMSLPYVAFLVLSLALSGGILINYLQIQAELTATMKQIARMEEEYNTKRVKNDEALQRIEDSIDLEAIKAVAIGELGMTYAKEGQIISYVNEGNDYMRKVIE